MLQVRGPSSNPVSNLGIPTSPIVITKNGVQSIVVGTEVSGGNMNRFATNVPPVPFKMQGWQRTR